MRYISLLTYLLTAIFLLTGIFTNVYKYDVIIPSSTEMNI